MAEQEDPVQRLKKRCREVMAEIDRYEQLKQEKFTLMDELHSCILWHEQYKHPSRSTEELNFWLAKELELYEFPVLLNHFYIVENIFYRKRLNTKTS